MTLKELREQNNLSQKEFSRKIGKSQSAVCMWEKGITRPRTNELCKIASILNTKIEDIIETLSN